MRQKIAIAVLISGTGSNCRNIIQYFEEHRFIHVSLIIANKENTGAPAISRDTGVPYRVVNRADFYENARILEILKKEEIQYLILAGFLWLIPDFLVKAFPQRIINIHPALLPKYGGKGMYGMKVHQAVKDAGERHTGITIHLVNEKYDEGEILSQEKVKIEAADSPEDIAQKVHQLEYQFFPEIIEKYIMKQSKLAQE